MGWRYDMDVPFRDEEPWMVGTGEVVSYPRERRT